MYTLISPTLHEEHITLEQLLSRTPYTLLYFYPKDDTPGCTLEAQEFTAHNEEFQNHGIQVIGVSKDLPKSHCSFISKYALKASYFSDPELTLHKQFGARGEKNNYGKIVQGVIRSTFFLDSKGTILHQWKNVKATGHATKVFMEVMKYLNNSTQK